MENKPSYYSIISANVRYDNRLSDSEKLLFAEITSLTQASGECWATNEYFAKLYEVSLVTISRRVSKLKKLGYIKVKMIYREGTKEILRRIIKIDTTYNQNCIEGIIKNDTTPIIKIDKENITSKSNNTSNNNKDIYSEVVDYLNFMTNKKYKLVDSVKSSINARLKEGYTLDDFKTVIDKKCVEWSNTEMSKYLRPQTLFGTKFDSYLNQEVKPKRNNYDSMIFDENGMLIE